jgi:coatomer subunit beta
MSSDPCYTILASNDLEPSTENELKNRLEKGSDSDKVDAMREIITSILNGDKMERLLMHVIRFVMPSKNKTLKKLLHFYWEVCPKYNPDGKLKQEMILVWYTIHP